MSEPTTWKVLVAEDKTGISAALLHGRGDFDVAVVHRLQAAERLLRDGSESPFQAVLLDVALADIADPQGLDAFRRLRAMAPGIPIVALIPAAAENAALALAAEGAAACLPQPSTTADVLAWTLRQAVIRAANEARRFRGVFDSVPVGILLTAGRRVAMANPAAQEQLGYSGEELGRVSVLDLFPADLRGRLESALDSSGAGRAGESGFRADLIRKDGSRAPARVLMKGALLHDAPALAFYLSFAPDAEAMVRDPGPKMEALARLSDGIVHDFNNLLTAINGYSDHLLSLPGVQGGAMARGLGAIRKAGEAAAALARGLAGFSHPGSGEPVAIPVDAAVEAAAHRLGALLGGAGRLELRPGAGPAAARLEPGQLEQILVNLCANAEEAGSRTDVVTVGTSVSETAEGESFTHLRPSGSGPYVVLTVQDAGRGMSREVQDRLFEPYFSTKGVRGAGCGLAAVFGIVRQAGGGIAVSSRPGHGSRFRIWLPCAAEEAEAAESRAQASGSRPADAQAGGAETIPGARAAASAGAARGGFGAGRRVTVVEDEPTLREMLKAVLERYGFEVSEAMSGEDAEADLRASGAAPDLLITDVLLRDGLGTEMAARMRAVHPGLRALFISGHSLDILEEQGIAIAPEEFLEKPFTPSQLAEIAGRLLATPARPVR